MVQLGSQVFGVVPLTATMVLRRPNASDLQKKALQLSKKLVTKYPRQRNVIVYNFNQEPLSKGVIFKKYQVCLKCFSAVGFRLPLLL